MTERAAAGTFLFLSIPVVLLLLAFDPAGTWWFPSCPFRALTGWSCPLCGSLRAIHALLGGDLTAAIAFNPLTTMAVVAGATALLADVMAPQRSSRLGRLCELLLTPGGLTIAILFGVIRNV